MSPAGRSVIEAVITADPIRRWRRRAGIARIARSNRPMFCLVSHEFGGGSQSYVDTLSRILQRVGIDVLIARCSGSGRLLITRNQAAGVGRLVYDLPSEAGELLRDMQRLGIAHFHFQSNINVPDEMFALPAQCGAAYDCTIHDYSWICPRVTLVDASRVCCGQPDIRVCERCVATSGRHPQWTRNGIRGVGGLRRHSASVLGGARRVFCPSVDVLHRLRVCMEMSNAVIRPHMEPHVLPPWRAPKPAPGEELRVAVLGAIGPEKGSEVLRRCAYDVLKRNLPLRFILIGHSDRDSDFEGLPAIVVTGRYLPAQLPELLGDYQPHISFFPGVLPETFSYTLSIALHCGLFPLAFDIGAIAERIRSTGYGTLLPAELSWTPAAVNEALLVSAKRAAQSPVPDILKVVYPDILADYYGFPGGLADFSSDHTGKRGRRFQGRHKSPQPPSPSRTHDESCLIRNQS